MMNKTKIASTFIITALFLPAITGAQDISEPEDIIGVFQNILNFLWSVFVVATVIAFIIAGMMYVTAAGEPTKLDRAKKMLVYGIIGATVAILSGSAEAIIRGFLSS